MYMRLKDGKTKVITLSYDDGVIEDVRLIEILDKNGMKGTFNLNTGIYPEEGSEEAMREKVRRMTRRESISLFKDSGHEVAVHTLTHPFLHQEDSTAVIHEVMEDRKNLEAEYGVIARGLAYPFGTYTEDTVRTLKECGICYARTTKSTYSFDFPENWLTLHPTCHHNDEKLEELIHDFIEKPTWHNTAKMFYLWGHSYEFSRDNNWEVIERFCEYAGNREDIWYATNIEIYDYVTAYKRLETSVDKKRIHNPTAIDLWFEIDKKVYKIKAGETLVL